MVENCVPNVLMLSGLGVRCGFTVALNLMLHVGGYWSAMRAGGSWFCRIKGGPSCPRHGSRAMDQIHGSGKGGAPFILHFRLSSARCVGHLVNILKYFRSYLFPHTEESLNFLAD